MDTSNELDFLQNRINSDYKKRDELIHKQQSEELAKKIRNIYDSFIEHGFSDEQAFWFVANMVKKAFKNS